MTTRLKPLLTLAALTTLLALPGIAQAAGCPNEEFRTGPSASLPECRAYELVTPEELGRTQDLSFTGIDRAIPSTDGEHLALTSLAPLEPEPSPEGTRVVFSRTAHGWTVRSAVVPELRGRGLNWQRYFTVLSPDLSQVAFESSITLNDETIAQTPKAFEVGPVGGPYTLVAEVPGGHDPEYEARFAGANNGTVSVPEFSGVVLESTDHQLLPPGSEREAAEELPEGSEQTDLYEWTGGALRLVNVEGQGSHMRLVGKCAAELGSYSPGSQGVDTGGAVSADGSKVFFSSCGGLYMRVDGVETVEVSRPAHGVTLNPAERTGVRFDVATQDGSEVVFNTSTPLLAGETSSTNRLFLYDTTTGELSLIKSGGLPETTGTGHGGILISEDGSTVYYVVGESIYRYEIQTGKTSFVAAVNPTIYALDEPSYITPDGRFLVFPSGQAGVEVAGAHGLELESRGVGHNELYRYDATDGSVMCVSCGEGVAPAEGQMISPAVTQVLETRDGAPPFVQMSDDGQRVFFQTTAQLVPQDTNSPKEETQASVGGHPGMDVYEWEADGVEEAPGVFCDVTVGCTHLLSSGEDVGAEYFLGATGDGSNVFFSSAAQLVPQATPEFSNIYDARVDGGFLPRERASECLSCQGVGSTAPLFGPGASLTFAGPGNPVAPVGNEKPESKPKPKPKRRHKKRTKAGRATGPRKGGKRS